MNGLYGTLVMLAVIASFGMVASSWMWSQSRQWGDWVVIAFVAQLCVVWGMALIAYSAPDHIQFSLYAGVGIMTTVGMLATGMSLRLVLPRLQRR